MGSVVLVSAAILGGLGLLFAVLIAVAHRKLWVWEDPRIDLVVELLPGTNCGACGQPGCRAFAEALVAGTTQPAQCTVMGPADVDEVAGYLGVEAGEALRRVARLLCAGGSNAVARTAEYRGLATCTAAAAVAAGGKACPWACLGYGDCRVACDPGAIYMNEVALPVVIPERCTACGDCVEACPHDLFTLMPVTQKLIVQCRNLVAGDQATALCHVACNGCGLCVADAAPGLIRIESGLAIINYENNELADPKATARCPTGAIAWIEGAQFTAIPSAAPANQRAPRELVMAG